LEQSPGVNEVERVETATELLRPMKLDLLHSQAVRRYLRWPPFDTSKTGSSLFIASFGKLPMETPQRLSLG